MSNLKCQKLLVPRDDRMNRETLHAGSPTFDDLKVLNVERLNYFLL